MPQKCSLVALALVSLAAPARADVITQVLGASQMMGGDFTPYDIVGTPFNPSLGTLTNVTAELQGSVVASIFRSDQPVSSTRLATRFFLFTLPVTSPASPNSMSGTLPDQIVSPIVLSSLGEWYTGAVVPFDQTFNFPILTDFIGTSASDTLLEFGFRASVPDLTTPSGGASDLTSFNGTLTLTYTYNPASVSVVEPTTASLLGVSMLGLAALRRRKVA